MRLPQHSRPREIGVDMVPMINIVFMLLVFVILAGGAARLSAPESVDAADAVLLIARDGGLQFAGAVLAKSELAPRIRAWHEQHPATVLSIRADAGLAAPRFVELLETLRGAGIVRAELLDSP